MGISEEREKRAEKICEAAMAADVPKQMSYAEPQIREAEQHQAG